MFTPGKTKSTEWFTPACYIQSARATMDGIIDLDPASCREANETVGATRYYSKAENGLAQRWWGNVWMNPPFERIQTPGQKTGQGSWINRLVAEHRNGNVTQATLLTTCRPDASWFSQLWEFPICFSATKVGFYCPTTGKILQLQSHAHGTIFVYLGPRIDQFVSNFQRFGPIVLPEGVRRLAPGPEPIPLWQ